MVVLCPAGPETVVPEPGGPDQEVEVGQSPPAQPQTLHLPGVLRQEVGAGPAGGHGLAEDGAVPEGSHLGDLRALLHHRHLQPSPGQLEGGGDADDSTSDDESAARGGLGGPLAC